MEHESIIDSHELQQLRKTLNSVPGVSAVSQIELKAHLINCLSIEIIGIGKLRLQRLRVEDSSGLYEFYFNGLSETARNFFPPYPLFSPRIGSAGDLSKRIKDWEKEADWTALKLARGSQIIGLGILKRFSTDRPTSGLAVRQEFQKMKLGLLLQTIINEQANLLGLARVFATASPDNIASIGLHQKCGFRLTGKSIPHFIFNHGERVIDRNDVELVKEFTSAGSPDGF